MERLDPNTISGWEDDIIGISNYTERSPTPIRELVPKVHGKTSLLYKSHIPFQEYIQEHQGATDFFLVTYRAPYDAMCSLAKKFLPSMFKRDEVTINECRNWARYEMEIQRLALNAPLGSLHIESSILRSTEGVMAIVKQLVEMWNVEPGTKALDLEGIVADVMRLEAPPEGIFQAHHPRSLMHPQHETAKSPKDAEKCKRIIALMSQDELCSQHDDRYRRLFLDEVEGNKERKTMYTGEEVSTLLESEINVDR